MADRCGFKSNHLGIETTEPEPHEWQTDAFKSNHLGIETSFSRAYAFLLTNFKSNHLGIETKKTDIELSEFIQL